MGAPMTPGQQAMLDQASTHIADLLATFGADRRDPAAMRGALAAVQVLTVIFHDCPGLDRDGILRGYLLNLAELQP